jgi:hypothetical protein
MCVVGAQRLDFPLQLRHAQYRLLHVLGGGAYASVFLATKDEDNAEDDAEVRLPQRQALSRDLRAYTSR